MTSEQLRALVVEADIRAIPLGHTKIETTVRYLGVGVEDALVLAESVEI